MEKADPPYLINGWRFDPGEPVLRGASADRRLEDRAARVLAVLCRRRGEVVSRDDLIAEVWGGRSVSANSVSIVIGILRRALDDDPADPDLLVTVARRGYRLLAPAGADGVVSEGMAASDAEGRRSSLRYATGRWLGGAVVLAVVAGWATLLWRPVAQPVIAVDPPRNSTGRSDLDGLAASLGPVVVDGVRRIPGVRVVDAGTVPPSLIVRSRLIIWNGAPELALSASDRATHAVVWTGFAAGPPEALAGHVTAVVAGLRPKLPR